MARRREGRRSGRFFGLLDTRARSGFLPSIGGPTNSLTIPQYLGMTERTGISGTAAHLQSGKPKMEPKWHLRECLSLSPTIFFAGNAAAAAPLINTFAGKSS